MAKGSGIGEIIGLGIAGVGVWWVGGLFGWWSGFGTAAATTGTTTTPAGTTTTTVPAATVQLNGPVTPTLNNALQAVFLINGASIQIAVIPNGDAYDNSGNDITATLAAEGVTPAQLYAIMAAAYTPAAAPATNASNAPATTTGTGGRVIPIPARLVNIANTLSAAAFITQFNTAYANYQKATAANQAIMLPHIQYLAQQIKAAGGTVPTNTLGLSGYGMGGPMVYAVRNNYVRRGAGYR